MHILKVLWDLIKRSQKIAVWVLSVVSVVFTFVPESVFATIKKWSFIQENYKDGYGKFTQFICNIHTIGMEEDFKKVKECLENDK